MLRWGIIGAGNIARRFVEGLNYDHGSYLQAVSCRTLEKAEAFSKIYGGKAYGSFDELLEDPDIDVVYIALPHKYHYEYAIKAMEHHKHVLCEKPVTVSVRELEDIMRVAKEKHVFFMEAMKSRMVPGTRYVHELIGDDKILSVKAGFCCNVPYPTSNYYYEKGQGGCLLDMGIYAIDFASQYGIGEIEKVEYVRHFSGIETYVNVTFKDGYGSISCAFDRNETREGFIETSKGMYVLDNFYRPQDITCPDGKVIHVDYDHTDFTSEIRHVRECIEANKEESDIMPLSASLTNMKKLEEIRSYFDLKIIGITGSIASGKSAVSSYLIEKGYKLLDADKLAHESYHDQGVLDKIDALFDCVVNNEVDRKKLGNIVFHDESKKKMLEDIIHPYIHDRIKEAIIDCKEKILFLDIPLLFECGYDFYCHEVWCVYVSEDTQITRLMNRNHIDCSQAKLLISNQMSSDEKRERANCIIDNNGTLDDLYKQIDKLLGGL